MPRINILKWWNSTHDELLAIQISQWQWVWYWVISDEIVRITPSATIEAWKKSDPLCSKYAWYNILMNFATARAEQLGLTRSIRRPERKTCPICNNAFVEDSLPMPIIETLGIDRLDFCAPCLRDTVLPGAGNELTSEQDIIKYLQDLASVIVRVPPQAFGDGWPVLLRKLGLKPTSKRVVQS